MEVHLFHEIKSPETFVRVTNPQLIKIAKSDPNIVESNKLFLQEQKVRFDNAKNCILNTQMTDDEIVAQCGVSKSYVYTTRKRINPASAIVNSNIPPVVQKIHVISLPKDPDSFSSLSQQVDDYSNAIDNDLAEKKRIEQRLEEYKQKRGECFQKLQQLFSVKRKEFNKERINEQSNND